MDKAELETTPILAVRWDERGLAQAVATDARTGALLTVAYIHAAALEQTIRTGAAHYWSRYRPWVRHKGSTSPTTTARCDLLAGVAPTRRLWRVRNAGAG